MTDEIGLIKLLELSHLSATLQGYPTLHLVYSFLLLLLNRRFPSSAAKNVKILDLLGTFLNNMRRSIRIIQRR